MPINEIDRNVFTGSIAVIDQDITLFEDSIADNIKIIALIISLTTSEIIFPVSTEDMLVGVMNNLANSPLSRSPAMELPYPNIEDMNMVIANTPGNKKSMYSISP